VDPKLSSREVEEQLAVLEQRIRTKRRARISFALVVTACALLFVVLRPTMPARSEIRTADGSVAESLREDTVMQVERDDEEIVAIRLDRGRGHFEVTKKPTRRYRVKSGDVEVEVLGTAFDVTRRDGSTHVSVTHGLVRVRWPGASTLLRAGESGTFPSNARPASTEMDAKGSESETADEVVDAEPALANDETNGPLAPTQPRTTKRFSAHVASAERWRSLEREGKHAEAFVSLGTQKVDDLSGLLLAADAARLSGHPREAAAHLQRLVARFPQSPSAKLAAFTLGRLALHELDDPTLAARSFSRAYALDPKGPLAEDALARQAEAYHRAGDGGRSSQAARRYLEQFPRGARRAAMEAYLAP